MKEVMTYISKDGIAFDEKEACLLHEESQAFSEEVGAMFSVQQYRRLKEYFKKVGAYIPQSAISVKPEFLLRQETMPQFSYKTPEEHRADALAYGERLEKPSNPGIGSNR